ncbi:MAG: GH39 family glycosyl hydrolase, partial [Candidatus Acidiferrales bacterium]
DVLVTRRKDGTLVVAVWNLVDPDKTGSTKTVRLIFDGLRNGAKAVVSRVDDEHGNTLWAYKAMGSPRYPTEDQIRRLNAATALPPRGQRRLEGNRLDLTLEPNALVLLEVEGGSF